MSIDKTPAEPKQTRTGSGKINRSRSKYFLAVFFSIVILAVVAGMIPRFRQHAVLASEARKAAVPRVTVVSPVFDSTGGTLLLPADIRPRVETPIYARASGYLKNLQVDLGSIVKKDQLLAVIETPDLFQGLDQARHQLAEKEAALSLAKITADRYAELVKSASVSEQDNAEKQADLSLKTAGVAAARADVRRLESLESFSRIIAPFGGTIAARNCDVGELISAGSNRELFRLSQTNKLRVYVDVPQQNADGIEAGQTAELLMSGTPPRQFPAMVVRTAGQISSDSRTLLTELEVDNENGGILAGSFGQVRIKPLKSKKALTIPTNTLMFAQDGPQVALVSVDNTIELRKVKIGRNFGPIIEITAGLEPDQRVVVNPSGSLIAGTPVMVIESGNDKKGGRE
jgi:RND family efflux transporter MFP subunit